MEIEATSDAVDVEAFASKMESGSADSAKKLALNANEMYRQAELTAVKTGILGQAWALINQADKEKMTRYAPTTFEKARSLANQAEKELSTNRYATSKPADCRDRTNRTRGVQSQSRVAIEAEYSNPLLFANDLECWGL